MLTFLISLALAVVGISAALHALMNKRDSVSALAWVTICLALPGIGALTYVVFGINRVANKALRSYLPEAIEDPTEIVNDPPACNLRPLSLVGENVSGLGLRSCDQPQLLENGDELYPAMIKDINSATNRVYCSTYIFQHDEIGKELVSALSRALQRKVEVRVIVDGLGAIAYPPPAGRALRAAKINVKYFNPITLFPPSLNINTRNHRKIMIVDGVTAYTGGQNISAKQVIGSRPIHSQAKDLHFRLQGKIVDDLERAFLKDWNHCSGITGKTVFKPSNRTNYQSKTWARLILDGPNEYRDKLNELLVGVVSSAQHRLWIMTPYFLPDLDLLGALIGARLRGVDVKIFLPRKTNNLLVRWAMEHSLQSVLARRLVVYMQPAPFIHTKALLIDDNYCLIGSANLDPRSLRLNYELAVEIFDQDFCAELAAYFAKQEKLSTPVTETELAALPKWRAFRNAMAWLFSPYL
ncbi:MAG: cardiolipin synthase [Pseudohongiellaceae bacterium]|jgi:cardiolipin synthase